MRINSSHSSNEKIRSGQIEQVGIDESRDRQSYIDLSFAGRQLTSFPSFGTVCAQVEREAPGSVIFFARTLGVLSYQTVATLSNMLVMKIFGVAMLPRFPKDEDNACLVSTFGARD
jgi:hypothetical protein